nr:uncharacterized protein LOC109169236 [Ipomoea batatas]
MKTPTTVFPLAAIQKLLKSIWGKWNIQAIVVASLAFQGILEFLAPVRKRSKKSSTHLIIWSVYLLADYFATFSIGLINSSAEDLGPKSSRIAAFWAPFLLLHLGGPHTITSFDLEDNNLWHRHLLTLLVQVLSVLLVFYRFQIYIYRELLIPTGIIFFAGIIKYAERTRSLYMASLSHMKKSMLESSSDIPCEDTLSTFQRSEEAVDRELEIIQMGYTYFQFFKGFIMDHGFSHIQEKLKAVKDFFMTLDHKEAYKVLEIELNFMYDALFTKMAAVQWMSSFGYGYRFVVHALLLAVALIFVFFPKLQADDLDISITYLLLGGAIFLDFVALAKLVFSLWTVAIMLEDVEKCKASPGKEESWISGLKRNHKIIKTIKAITTWISSRRRWSNEIRQYSLINHSIKQGWPLIDPIAEKSGLTERLDAWRYTITESVGCGLLEQVFQYIKKKAETDEAKDGGGGGEPPPTREVRYKDYDDCVLIWHVATEICYFSIDSGKEDDPNRKICRNISEYLVYFLVMEGKLTSTVPGNIGMRFRDICWEEVKHTREELKARLDFAAVIGKNNYFLDYMKHMASAKMEDFKDFCTITNWKNNHADTDADTCDRKRSRLEQVSRKWEDKKRKDACKWLLDGFPEKENKSENDYYPKSILPEAVKLAKHLKSCCCSPGDVENPEEEECSHHNNPNRPDDNSCSEKELWEILRHVWVGLLLYGASHCRDDVQYLNKGGELLTFVRLLMVHFGLTDAFKIEGGFKLEAELHQVIHQHKNLLHFLPKIISNFLP